MRRRNGDPSSGEGTSCTTRLTSNAKSATRFAATAAGARVEIEAVAYLGKK